MRNVLEYCIAKSTEHKEGEGQRRIQVQRCSIDFQPIIETRERRGMGGGKELTLDFQRAILWHLTFRIDVRKCFLVSSRLIFQPWNGMEKHWVIQDLVDNLMCVSVTEEKVGIW